MSIYRTAAIVISICCIIVSVYFICRTVKSRLGYRSYPSISENLNTDKDNKHE